MKVILFFLTVSLFFLLSSCNKQDDPGNDCLPIITDKNLFDNGVQDATTKINDVSIVEECIIMSISYSGGCETHDIQLVTDGMESFSNPPAWVFKLIHDNNDPCEAYLTEDWEYDLNSLDFNGGFLEIEIEGYSDKFIVDLN